MKSYSTGLHTALGMVVSKGFCGTTGRAALGVVALLWAVAAHALDSFEVASPPVPVSYASVSDQELTDIAAHWDDLDAQERRALLLEVKTRMKRKGATQGILRFKVGRRYGAVIRHADGTTATLHIDIRSVKRGGQGRQGSNLPAATPEAPSVQEGTQGFGVGFERRIQRGGDAPPVPESEPPVIRVADPE